jgi:regulator of protease activity HflC (stomatin/prohibitin superfamily)
MDIVSWLIGIIVFIIVVLVAVLRQVNQFERGVLFTMGRFSSIQGPGWRLVVPVFQQMKKIDMRVKAVEVPEQQAITKDNVSVGVTAVIYYRVVDAGKVVMEVENFIYATSQLAQTTMRNTVGEVELDDLLSGREKISEKIRSVVDATSEVWGIKVSNVELKDISLPADMERTIAKQAEAERERRAVIIKAEGEVAASTNLAKAAGILSAVPGALHLRTLQSINDISSDESNTIVFAMPLEVLRAIEKVADSKVL